jgi:hypothetical protein
MCGYALYTQAEWNGAASGYKDGTLFLYESGAPTPILFLPAAGYRYSGDGDLHDMYLNGNYWSSSVSGAYAYYLDFTSTYVYPNANYYRASGFSVRCVAEPY